MMILNRIKAMMSLESFRVSLSGLFVTAFKMVTSFISLKVVASLIGPAGVALIGQLNNFTTVLLQLANGGITVGLTKYVSEFSDERNKYARYITAACYITLVASLVVSLALVFGAGFLSEKVLGSNDYRFVFIVFGLSLVFYALNAFVLAVSNGFKEYRVFFLSNLVGSIMGLVFTVILTYRFGINGALISVVTYQSIAFLCTIPFFVRHSWLKPKAIFTAIDKSAVRQLFSFSVMALVAAINGPLNQMFIRNYIINQHSLNDAGIWEGVNRISNMYLYVVMTALSIYFLPKLAALSEKAAIRKEIFSTYKMIMPFLFIGAICIYVFRSLIITILFTPAFSPMSELFPYQLTGDICKMAGWVLGYLMLAKAMTKTYLVMEVISFSCQIGFSILFLNIFGLKGAPIGYTLGHLTYFLLLVIIFRDYLFGGKNEAKLN